MEYMMEYYCFDGSMVSENMSELFNFICDLIDKDEELTFKPNLKYKVDKIEGKYKSYGSNQYIKILDIFSDGEYIGDIREGQGYTKAVFLDIKLGGIRFCYSYDITKNISKYSCHLC